MNGMWIKRSLTETTKSMTVFKRLREFAKEHPRFTNTVIYGSTGTFGAEFFQQTLMKKIMVGDGKREPYDWGSLARYWVAGYLIFPHVFWHWYKFLDRLFPVKTTANIIKKTLTDQVLSPAPILILFYTSMSLMEGKRNIMEECKAKLEKTLKMRYVFMLPAAAINFAVIPPHLRVAWQGITTFFWVNILCYLKRLKIEDTTFQSNAFVAPQ